MNIFTVAKLKAKAKQAKEAVRRTALVRKPLTKNEDGAIAESSFAAAHQETLRNQEQELETLLMMVGGWGWGWLVSGERGRDRRAVQRGVLCRSRRELSHES